MLHFFLSFNYSFVKTTTPFDMASEDQVSLNQMTILNLPSLWRLHVKAWFTQAKAYFDLRKITQDSTKINYVILSLSSDLISDVYDILANKYQVYEDLKAALIKRFRRSEQERITQLLSSEALGDRTPSELLRRMQALLTDNFIDTSLFRQVFLQKLPSHVREILASISDETSLTDLASIADKILVVKQQEPPTLTTNTLTVSTTSSLQHQINLLSARLEQLAKYPSHTSPRRRRRSRSRATARSRCWYHTRFGSKARKCVPPCDFHAAGNATANP